MNLKHDNELAYLVIRRTKIASEDRPVGHHTLFVSKSYDKIKKTIERFDSKISGNFKYEVVNREPKLITLYRYTEFTNLIKAETDQVWVLETAYRKIRDNIIMKDDEVLDLMFAVESDKEDFKQYLRRELIPYESTLDKE